MSDYVHGLREKIGHDLIFQPSVACLIRDDDGRLLLVRNVEGWWTLPAGAVDPGETPAEAARRETREERVPAPGDDETQDVRWVSPSEALELDLSPATRHMLTAIDQGYSFN
jgi:8-oxo-dGTP pyrophosphatase MutT (NUDIX family)